MRSLSALFALAGFAAALSLAASAGAQTIDKAGNCHAKDGKLAKMEVCKPASMAKAGPCKDPKTGKFIACAAVVQKGPCKDPKTGKFTACPAKAAAPAAKPATATMAKPTKK